MSSRFKSQVILTSKTDNKEIVKFKVNDDTLVDLRYAVRNSIQGMLEAYNAPYGEYDVDVIIHNHDDEYIANLVYTYVYENQIKERRREPIPYNRLVEIATKLKDGLIEDDEYEALYFMREEIELTEEEADFFEVDLSKLDNNYEEEAA